MAPIVATCKICGERYFDTTTCPRCEAAFARYRQTHARKLQERGINRMGMDEWLVIVLEKKKRDAGEISAEEYEKRKEAQLKAVRQRIVEGEKRERQSEQATRDFYDI